MLTRYTSDAMATVWSEDARYARWRQVELAVLEARAALDLTPSDVYAAVTAMPTPTVANVSAVETATRHDLLAFLYAWTDQMDPAVAAHIHRDLTSSDVVDTAQAVALGAATDLIVEQAKQLILSLADKALAHQATLCVARTHGQPAALDVVGHRFIDFAFAVDRGLARLEDTHEQLMVANLSGPVGTGVGLPLDLASRAAQILGLALPAVTTQVVFRDLTAAWVADLALLGATCEAVATDIRIGQHDGVAEMAEPRGAAQEGSSAMPHKRNPIAAENVTGVARLLRGYVQPALESIALWQHRDISHSSVERVVLPDVAALAEHILRTTVRLVDGLHIDHEQLQANIDRAGPRLMSSRLLSRQLDAGAPRREAMARVREQVDSMTMATSEVETAAAEVLASDVLSRSFAFVADLRERHATTEAGSSVPDIG